MFSSSTRRALADVTTLRKDVASGAMLARFAYAGVQGFFAVPSSELRGADAPVIGWVVLLHSVIPVFVIVLVVDVVVVIALGRRATLPRVLLRPSLIDRGAMGPFAPNNIHAALVPILPAFLDPPALAAVAEILFEDRLARGAVLAGQIGARILPALFHAVALQDVLVVAHVKVHEIPIDLQLSYAAEETVVGANVVVNSVK